MRESSMLHGKHFPSMIDHRSLSFPELTMSLVSHLKQLFSTDQGQGFSSPSSGTGAWEAALSNTLPPGSGVTAAMENYRSNAPAT